MNRLIRIGVAVALAAASTLAISQGAPNPEAAAKSAIEARQAIFKLIGTQMAPIGGLGRAGGPPPDLAVVARNAARVQTLADMIPELFTANPTAPASVKTRALPVIWTGQADFKAKAEALSKAAAAVADAAKKGDLAATQAAARQINPACSGCHDTYRGPAAP
jgi:cytochrome c556